jgi:hypothetical protein
MGVKEGCQCEVGQTTTATADDDDGPDPFLEQTADRRSHFAPVQ